MDLTGTTIEVVERGGGVAGSAVVPVEAAALLEPIDLGPQVRTQCTVLNLVE